jgi:RNA polymerase sigma-70 factor, ECF subfamily
MADLDVFLNGRDLAFAHAVARRFFRDPQDAADAAQEALLAAFRHRESFRGESKLSTWLHRIVVTTSLDLLRKRRRQPAATSLEGGLDVESPERSPEAQLVDADEASQARRCLRALGETYDRVFRMRFEEQLGEAEVARALGLTVATVKIRTHRARHAARAALTLAHEGAR